MLKKLTNKQYIYLLIINLLFFGAGYILDIELLNYIGIFISLLLCCFSSIEQSFMLLLSLISFNNFFVVSNISIRGLIYFIPTLKIMYSLYKQKLCSNEDKKILICFFVVVTIEICNELVVGQFSSLINILCGLFSFFAYLLYFNNNSVKHLSVYEVCLILGCLSPLIIMLIRGGGIYSYNNSISYYRFGQESLLLGGPMGAVIYSSLLIGISLKNIIIKNKFCFNVVILIIALCLGFLTISRTFLVILFAIFICLLYYFYVSNKSALKKGKNSLIGKKTVVIFIFVTVGIIIFNFDFIINVISKFTVRSAGILNDPRIAIAKESLSFLANHPLHLLIGFGSAGYQYLGEVNDLLFSMYTHNIFLDVLMSWGIIGMLFLFYSIFCFFKDVKKSSLTDMLPYMLPMISFLVNGLFGGTFNYLYNYPLLLLLMLLLKERKLCQ